MQRATDIMQHATSRPGETAVVPTLHAMPCHAMAMPCHAMPCHAATRTGAASTHWFCTSRMSYSARRMLQCTACMLHATGYVLHACMYATCSVQHAAWLHACRRPGTCAASISAVMPRSVPFSVTCHLHGACEPSRSMIPLRARATRVWGVPQPCRTSKCSPLAAAPPGEDDNEASKGPSVLGGRPSCRVHAARRAAT
jgi:hypothetical protein